jgi:hypothetical protein
MLGLLAGVDVAYYLVHSLGIAGEFGDDEVRAASTFAETARQCGVGRLAYLGGIVHDDDLSPHLASRREVGEILRASGVPTIEFRGVLATLPVLPAPLPASALPERLAELVPERARLAANLLESLRHGTAVEDDSALRDFDVRPLALRDAVAVALG